MKPHSDEHGLGPFQVHSIADTAITKSLPDLKSKMLGFESALAQLPQQQVKK